MPLKPSTEKRTALRIADDHVTVPPRANLIIAVYCQYAVPDTDDIVVSGQSLLLEHGLSVARGIAARLKQRKSHVLVPIFSGEYQHFNKGVSISFLEEIQEASDVIAVADFQREPDEVPKPPHFIDMKPALSQKKAAKDTGFGTPLQRVFFFDPKVTPETSCKAPDNHRRWNTTYLTVTLPRVVTRA